MSAAIQVYLHQSRLPGIEQWNAAIKAEGFELTLQPFNLLADSGYRPATLQGEDSGFEWYLSAIEESGEPIAPEIRKQIRDADRLASLCFGSRGDEATAAAIAGAVLAKLTGGHYLDADQGDKLLPGDAAIAAARQQLEAWRKIAEDPARYIAAATTAVLVPLLKPLGFVRVRPLDFARMSEGIVHNIWIAKRDGEFRGGWTAQSLYPALEFMPGGLTPIESPHQDWRAAGTPEQTDAGMKELADLFARHALPWFEQLKTDADYLNCLLEFSLPGAHNLFEIGCLQIRLGQTGKAAEKLNQAIIQYGEVDADWAIARIALGRELLAAIQNGSAIELLEKCKIQSLQNLGFKKLLKEPRAGEHAPAAAENATLPPANIPPPITAEARTAAAFSREKVRPAMDAMMARILPEFALVEVRGPDSFYRRAGTARLFDFVICSRHWEGALRIELAASYDANWRGLEHQLLGCHVELAGLRLRLTGRELHSNPAAWRQQWYHYGRSESELVRQIALAGDDLSQHAPPFFVGARQIMQSIKLLQFGLQSMGGRSLTDPGKAALRRELRAVNSGTPVAHPQFLELHRELEQFAAREPDVSGELRGKLHQLTAELLLADLNLSPTPPPLPPGGAGFWDRLRKR